ncbi:MAG: hypothetical protein JJV92_10995 [Desulfosarcina sp.]|nr:hypothetical protein [Desulfobacterales bacterium]
MKEAEKLLSACGFEKIGLKTKLGPGDLLTIRPSKRYEGLIYKLMWKVYPRWLVRLLGDQFGLGLLITGVVLSGFVVRLGHIQP